MAGESFIQLLDQGVRALMYSKFGSTLGLTSLVTQVAAMPKSVAQRMVAEGGGQSALPMISVWRDIARQAKDRSRTALARHGLYLEYIDEGGEENTSIVSVKTVAVDLDYTVSFWSHDFGEVANALDLYFFWRYNSPVLTLNYSYGSTDYPLECHIDTADAIDASNIDNMYQTGNYYVVDVPLRLKGWIFTELTSKTIKEITLKMYDNEGDENVLLLEETLTCTTP